MLVQSRLASCLTFMALNYYWGISSAGYTNSENIGLDLVRNAEKHSSSGAFEPVAVSDQHHLEVGAHDSLGSLGDHLDEQHFPADIEAGFYKSDDLGGASHYGEELAATEAHSQLESLAHERAGIHYNELNLGGGEHFKGPNGADLLYAVLEREAVKGLDHGKGAFSYSTLYETKDEE